MIKGNQVVVNSSSRVSRLIFLLWLLMAFATLSGTSAAQSVRYIHTDALGSVVAESNNEGIVVERREYEPYGQQLTPILSDGPGFTGHVQDAATGLTYMQQRYYDPSLGLFLSVDPVDAYSDPITAFHRYRYANTNPYRFTDPDGRQSWDEMWKGIGDGGAAAATNGPLYAAGTESGSYRAGYAAGVMLVRGGQNKNGMRIPAMRMRIAPPTANARLPQDLAVNPTPPAALPTNRPVGRSRTQNSAAQAEVRRMQDQGYTDIRVNQQQVDASGTRVGTNRPDLQGTSPSGVREYVEFDTTRSSRGPVHESRINANDPSGKVDLRRVN